MNRPNRNKRAAFSLLEVVVGMVVAGMILVPTTAMMSDVMKGEAVQRSRAELLPLARGKQSEFAHLSRVRFRNHSGRGTFSSEGYPHLRYTVTCSQSSSDGGIPNRLVAIRTLAWHDANGNRTLDSNETSIDLWTSVARATR